MAPLALRNWVLKKEYKIHKQRVPVYKKSELGHYYPNERRLVDFATKKKRRWTIGSNGFELSYYFARLFGNMEPYCYLENDVLTNCLTTMTPGNDLAYPGLMPTEAFWRPWAY